jgi:transcriptional regulator with XRE-family HTH domain
MPVVGEKISAASAELKAVLRRTHEDQKDLAKRAGITPAMLNHLLYGRKRPSNKTAFALETASGGKVRARSWTVKADPLTVLPGVTEAVQTAFYAACYTTYSSLAGADPATLVDEVKGLQTSDAEMLIAEAAKFIATTKLVNAESAVAARKAKRANSRARPT